MKSMKKLHVAAAVTALFAVSGSMAASISQSGLTVAREVISANATSTQTIKAPAASYNFDNGPTANAFSSQDFNVTLALNVNGGDGTPEWGANVPTYKTIAAVRRNSANAVVPVVAAGHVDAGAVVFIRLMGVDAVDSKTQRFRFRLENQSAASVSLGDLQVSFNSVNPGQGAAAPYILTPNAGTFDAGAAANNPLAVAPVTTEYNNIGKLAGAANAATVATGAGETKFFNAGAGTANCGEDLRRITLLARNYIGSGTGVEGESSGALLSAITNNGYIVFGTALGVKVEVGAAKNRATDPTSNNVLLTIPTASGVANDVMALGRVVFTNTPGLDTWDTATTGQYYKFSPTAAHGGTNEFTAGVSSTGDVDVNQGAGNALALTITSSNGFATGTTFALSNSPTCDAVGASLVTAFSGATTAGATTASISYTTAQLISLVTGAAATSSLISPSVGTYAALFGAAPGAGNNGFYLCMKVPGGSVQIPQSSFSAVAKLLKDDTTEQTNVSCPGDLAGLGGGVKIDVRNFYPYTSDTQEWISVLRVINNSETVDADLTFQYIRADGKYGQWGQVVKADGTTVDKLPARGARYFTSKEIAAIATKNTTTAALFDNTGAGGTTAPAGQAVAPNTRVRVSSNAASTLRVQNYMFNTRTLQLVEVSASQGADFVNVESSARDHIDQDAQTGIKK